MTVSEGLRGDLERSCGDRRGAAGRRGWLSAAASAPGLERVEAQLRGEAYAPHRHDSYAIGLTLAGVQCFDYRGEARHSLPGRVVALFPDELHDGRAGVEAGFRYRMLYVDPWLLSEALDGAPPPFLPDPVSADPRLTRAVAAALLDLDQPLQDLRVGEIVQALAEALTAASGAAPRPREGVDQRGVARAREYLTAQCARPVRREELEAESGLDRWRLNRQFRALCGVSPYRFLTMRRLDRARRLIGEGRGLAEAALDAGFADQSHMSRQFLRAYGLSPGRWRRLVRAAAGEAVDGSEIGGFLPRSIL